ncbi:DUF2231 domain-containing protein [Citricoccus sp. NPDC079358]|uniref:DUF2231 domain-containing protein n=1 Tax=Citricoccus sp. NPDC079358 TaxID=3154653 RepID=UPI00344DD588
MHRTTDGEILSTAVLRTVAESSTAERLAAAQRLVYGPILDWVRHSPFHTNALGHSVHPPLTDITLGSWMGASLLDLAGGTPSRHGATLLVSAGLLAAIPTALAGAADWTETEGADHRIGAVHALGTDAAVFLFLGSLIARLRDRHTLGVGLAAAGNVVAASAGFLGGHLALTRGTAGGSGPTERGE